MEKRRCIESALNEYRAMLDRARAARQAAQQDANDHKGRLVSRYDTFKEEAQYLAAGQGLRCLELENMVTLLEQFLHQCPSLDRSLETACPGALVTVCTEIQDKARYLIAPHGGGLCLHSEEGELWVVNSASPLARALQGKKAGDRAIYTAAGRTHHLAVVSVC